MKPLLFVVVFIIMLIIYTIIAQQREKLWQVKSLKIIDFSV